MSSTVSGLAIVGAERAGAAAGAPVLAASPGALTWPGADWVGTPRTPPVVCACEELLTAELLDDELDELVDDELDDFPVGQIMGLPGWTPPPSA